MKSGKSRKPKVRAVVPKVVFSKVFVGVVPACVAVGLAAACSSGGTTCTGPGCNHFYGVASVAYQCFDASDPNCRNYGVAAVAYQCFDAGRPVPCDTPTPDAASDAPSDSNSDSDAPSDASDSG